MFKLPFARTKLINDRLHGLLFSLQYIHVHVVATLGQTSYLFRFKKGPKILEHLQDITKAWWEKYL